jgi:triosephosphate isomerase
MALTRRPMIAGNWKMNLNHLEAIALTQKIAFSLSERQLTAAEVVVLPPFVDLRSVQTLIDGDRMLLGYGAQDLSPYDSGAYTGDISGPMLTKLGCSYVLVGHSERREYHAEDDAVVNAKVKAAFKHGLIPILCVGEPLEIRSSGDAVPHCTTQIAAALEGVTAEQAEKLVVAYEPIWAIGTGQVATPEDAQEVCAAVRAQLAALYATELAAGTRILYGGSVKGGNARELLAPPDVDGALVGGASLDGTEFATICAAALPLAG